MNENQMAIYETEDGKVRIDVLFDKENIWLTQKLMAQLFECSADNISLHLKNIYAERELDEESTSRNSRQFKRRGKERSGAS